MSFLGLNHQGDLAELPPAAQLFRDPRDSARALNRCICQVVNFSSLSFKSGTIFVSSLRWDIVILVQEPQTRTLSL